RFLVFPEIEVVHRAELFEEGPEARIGGRRRARNALAVVAVCHSSSPGAGTTRFTIAGPISSSGRVTSTQPVARAACGMPAWAALAGDWAIVVPPLALTARVPSAPSTPDPDRITEIARSP